MVKLYKSFHKLHFWLSTGKKILVGGMTLIFTIITVSRKNACPINPPVEENGFSKLTAYESMMAYFTKLSSQSKLISMTIIGKPVRGREYPIVRVVEPIVAEESGKI